MLDCLYECDPLKFIAIRKRGFWDERKLMVNVSIVNTNNNAQTSQCNSWHHDEDFFGIVHLVPADTACIGLSNAVVCIHGKWNAINELENDPPNLQRQYQNAEPYLWAFYLHVKVVCKCYQCIANGMQCSSNVDDGNIGVGSNHHLVFKLFVGIIIQLLLLLL